NCSTLSFKSKTFTVEKVTERALVKLCTGLLLYQELKEGNMDRSSSLKWMKTILLILALICGCYGKPQDLSGTKFTIAAEKSNSFIKLSGDFSKPITAMTMCQRFFTDQQRDQSLFSLATPSNPTDINLLLLSKGGYNLHIHGGSVTFSGMPENRNAWISVCATWDSKTGLTQIWANGRRSVSKILKLSGPINGTPSIILGQNQGSYGGGFVASQSFVGDITDVNFWDMVISPCQIKLYMQGKNFTQGSSLNWKAMEFTTGESVFHGLSDFSC
ncbi:hypothetical protein UPYG_G00141330, partial [Umbra pygmaea]